MHFYSAYFQYTNNCRCIHSYSISKVINPVVERTGTKVWVKKENTNNLHPTNSWKVELIESNIYSNVVHMFRTFQSLISETGANLDIATEPLVII